MHTLEEDVEAADDLLIDEELTPEELAELARLDKQWQEEHEAKCATYERKILTDAGKTVTQWYKDCREEMVARGLDVTDFIEERSVTPQALGFRSTTWDDQRNVTRRAREATRRVSQATANARHAAQLAQSATQQQPAENAPTMPVETPKPAPAPIASPEAKSPPQATPAPAPAPPPAPPPIRDAAYIKALEHYLQAAGKGLSYPKRAALVELARAKVHGTAPAPFVKLLSEPQRRDLEMRLQLAMQEAEAHHCAEKAALAQREQRQRAAYESLLPVVAQLNVEYKELARRYPAAKPGLCRAFEYLKHDAGKIVADAGQPRSAPLTPQSLQTWYQGHRRSALATVARYTAQGKVTRCQ